MISWRNNQALPITPFPSTIPFNHAEAHHSLYYAVFIILQENLQPLVNLPSTVCEKVVTKNISRCSSKISQATDTWASLHNATQNTSAKCGERSIIEWLMNIALGVLLDRCSVCWISSNCSTRRYMLFAVWLLANVCYYLKYLKHAVVQRFVKFFSFPLFVLLVMKVWLDEEASWNSWVVICAMRLLISHYSLVLGSGCGIYYIFISISQFSTLILN